MSLIFCNFKSYLCLKTMKNILLIIILFIGACKGTSNDLKSEGANDTTTFTTNDTIPATRKEVSTKPVASYLVPTGKGTKEKFGVEIFETPLTFQYLLRMQYDWMKVTDTLKLPNFGTWPVVEIKPGKEKFSCIIGFLDKKKQFKEYKMLTAKNDKLKLVVLKRYFVGAYRTASDQ